MEQQRAAGGGIESDPPQPLSAPGPADQRCAAAGGGGAGGDGGTPLALAGQPHRSEPALLSARGGGDSRWPGASNDGATRQRGDLQPGLVSGRDSPAALRPRCGVGTVARPRRRSGRGGGAVLAQAGGDGGDPGAGGGAGGGTDTEAVEEVFVTSASQKPKIGFWHRPKPRFLLQLMSVQTR